MASRHVNQLRFHKKFAARAYSLLTTGEQRFGFPNAAHRPLAELSPEELFEWCQELVARLSDLARVLAATVLTVDREPAAELLAQVTKLLAAFNAGCI